ncbi:MAG TPA: SCO family protein [Anaeromyxobacteraceae bacterium]|nr:SCO family protein [Anaeromyxobacteraceae bacterium]
MKPSRMALAAALTALALPAPSRAEDPQPSCHSTEVTAAEKAPPVAEARVEVPDVELVDQDGKPVRLRELLSGNKAVVADFVFTTCTTVCPVLSGILSKMQDRFGDRLGKDVIMLSVTLDPARDTPAKLKAYAKRWKARPGWVWLTGPKDTVEKVLRGMGAYTPNFTDHPPMVLVGDARTGTWTRYNGFPDTKLIVARVGEINGTPGGKTPTAPAVR